MSDPILLEARPLAASTSVKYARALRRFDEYRAALPAPEPVVSEYSAEL